MFHQTVAARTFPKSLDIETLSTRSNHSTFLQISQLLHLSSEILAHFFHALRDGIKIPNLCSCVKHLKRVL